jgi:hypothetical protein
MLFVDMSAVKLPGEVKLNNLPPECGQLIDAGDMTEEKPQAMRNLRDNRWRCRR